MASWQFFFPEWLFWRVSRNMVSLFLLFFYFLFWRNIINVPFSLFFRDLRRTTKILNEWTLGKFVTFIYYPFLLSFSRSLVWWEGAFYNFFLFFLSHSLILLIFFLSFFFQGFQFGYTVRFKIFLFLFFFVCFVCWLLLISFFTYFF